VAPSETLPPIIGGVQIVAPSICDGGVPPLSMTAVSPPVCGTEAPIYKGEMHAPIFRRCLACLT
jgi:hypothetical protein